MRELLIAVGLVFSGFAITNPGKPAYLDWLQSQVHAGPFGMVVLTLARPIVNASTTVENFVVLSVFTTSIDATHAQRTIGLANCFIPIPAAFEAWRPGARSAQYPHVIAAQVKDQWLPEAGYRWINNPPAAGDFRTKWVPGTTQAIYPHVVTTTVEGRWLPEDGYTWISQPPKPGDLRVQWSPGRPSSLHEHVVAAQQEQRWLPEEGFTWITNPPAPGDFRVRRIASDDASGLPILHGRTLRQCNDHDHFRPDTPCWFSGDTGIYVASKLGNMRSTTFAHWPYIDGELADLDNAHTLAPSITSHNPEIGEMLAKCSAEADAKDLFLSEGFGDARRAFRRECMIKMGVAPLR